MRWIFSSIRSNALTLASSRPARSPRLCNGLHFYKVSATSEWRPPKPCVIWIVKACLKHQNTEIEFYFSFPPSIHFTVLPQNSSVEGKAFQVPWDSHSWGLAVAPGLTSVLMAPCALCISWGRPPVGWSCELWRLRGEPPLGRKTHRQCSVFCVMALDSFYQSPGSTAWPVGTSKNDVSLVFLSFYLSRNERVRLLF